MFDYKYVIWDWNGTLINDNKLVLHAINALLKRDNKDLITFEQYQEYYSHPAIHFWHRIGYSEGEASHNEWSDEFINIYFQGVNDVNLHEGVGEILSHIHNKGIRQSVLSAHPQSKLEEIIGRHNLTSFFDYIYGLSDNSGGKKIERGRELLELIDCPKSDIVMIGDTDHDFEVATELGINCMLIANGCNPRARLDKLPVKVFSSMNELCSSINVKEAI